MRSRRYARRAVERSFGCKPEGHVLLHARCGAANEGPPFRKGHQHLFREHPRGAPNFSHYIASKGGVIGFTRALARELGDYNIHVNAVTPGAIQTESEKRTATQQAVDAIVARQCLKRRVLPPEIAAVCLFLASDLSDSMTGQTLNVDCGIALY